MTICIGSYKCSFVGRGRLFYFTEVSAGSGTWFYRYNVRLEIRTQIECPNICSANDTRSTTKYLPHLRAVTPDGSSLRRARACVTLALPHGQSVCMCVCVCAGRRV